MAEDEEQVASTSAAAVSQEHETGPPVEEKVLTPDETPALQEEPAAETPPVEAAVKAEEGTTTLDPASATSGLLEVKEETTPAVLRGQDEGSFLEKESSDSQTTKSVSEKRKKALLLEARLDRLAWIDTVPLPMSVTTDSIWSRDSRLQAVQAAAVQHQLGGTLSALEHLYGLTTTTNGDATSAVADRIQDILGSDPRFQQESQPTGEQVLQLAVKKNSSDVLEAYQDFWNKIRDPAAAMLVQGMRRFCRGMKEVSDREIMAAKLRSYLSSTFDSLKSHVLWKEQGADVKVRRSLESFVYGQCHETLESVLWNEEAKDLDKTWLDKLASLQFVGPSHLEIACFDDAANTQELLEDPKAALQSVDTYYAPFEKLQRILAVYHGVNAALSDALNRNRGGEKKLPSADDVLPTIIFLVLQGRPARLHYNLSIVEEFCPPEYLRGEAGYAFTNLYGAVQFLHNLNVDEPQSLSIGAEEFKKGLQASRAAMQTRFDASQEEPLAGEDDDATAVPLPEEVHISARDVYTARMKGEIVDLDWAMQLHQQQKVTPATTAGESTQQQPLETVAATNDVSMPVGFTRNYSFLATKPEDIKVADLPQLLAEYRTLVHTTERLLGERASQAATERKVHLSVLEDEIRVREHDLRQSK